MMRMLSTPTRHLAADQMYYSPEENNNMRDIYAILPNHRYQYGFNKDAGDKGILWKIRGEYKVVTVHRIAATI